MSNISCLETLALNILNNISPEKVAESVVISEQEPCSKCNEELFLYEIKRPLTILSCGHTFHRDCIERSIRKSPSCPRPDCKKEVELAVNNSPEKQKDDNDLMDISPSLFNDSPLFPNFSPQKKRVNESIDKVANKKAKKLVNRNDSPILKKLIEELSSEMPQDPEVIEGGAGNFFDLFDAIVKMEERTENMNRDVLKSYFNFGKALDDCFNRYMKVNPKRTAQALVNNEVRNQLPNTVSDNALRKKKERALKIFELFNAIGEDKIQRIKSITASAISKLGQDEIDKILIRLAFVGR
jgi:hypothetical protein